MRDETMWWMQASETDFRSARVLFEAGVFNNAAFFLQQASEKAMKALLREHGEKEPTHSTLGLMHELKSLGETFPDNFDRDLRRLDRCFIDTRYPNGVGGPPEAFYDGPMVEELFQCCQRVMAFVKSRLN